eukprot:CAMPEP_0179125430 /NCGR_PEP_ID=MMETSP0796-20121207/59319_1 /TAXON_ID=73915 /ORGANISM="Pyrodinium bahamense, Strain pbaha01" /LENGTH=59 /DNA_ID=CAMNT_0020824127 /DNA_START=29 /DNA_END=205 /DNA_ORIENTATION=-
MDKLLKPSLTMGVVDPASIKDGHIAKPPAPKTPPAKKPAKGQDAEEGEVFAVEEFVKPP